MLARPMKKLVTAMQAIEHQEWSYRLSEEEPAEFQYVFRQYNQMVNQIEILIRQVYEKQVQMTLAREFYLAVRLKNEKPDTAYTLLSTIETKFRDNGFTTRRAGKEDLKRLLAIYFEQNTTTERFEDYDGQRFMEATG